MKREGGARDPGNSPREPAAYRPSRARKLHIGHFAFMRAVLQGLDTRDSWDRYLRIEGEHDDLRHVNRTVAWIRDEFAAAAKRHARHGIARLVRIDARELAASEPQLPTLEEFAHLHDLHDFAQHEQLEQYQARHGSATRHQWRRSRLLVKQLAALDWLERLVVQPPGPDDMVAAWLHPDLAGHLERAGVLTIRQLTDRINGLGMRWWFGIRAIGTTKAQRILEWLSAHEATIGLAIGEHVKVKRSTLGAPELSRVVPPTTAIVPIEKLVVPAELDGATGLCRAPAALCRISAANDVEAVLAWVKAKHGLPEDQTTALKRKRGIDAAASEGASDWLRYLSNTQRAYLKEAERFMLWAIVQHKKPLSSMMPDDCEAYRAFLAIPTPAERWCGARGRERWGPLWRPFEGPLSLRAQAQAVTILKSLFQFLVDQCYLISNPWKGVVIPKAAGAKNHPQRGFARAQWQFIESQLDALPKTSAHRRLRCALHLMEATGLRLAQVVAVRVDDLKRVTYRLGMDDGQPADGWELRIAGKGDKERWVPVSLDVIRELSAYLLSRGLHQDPAHPTNRGAYLVGKAVDVAERAPWSPKEILQANPKEGIAAGRLYKVVRALFAECAKVLAQTDIKEAELFTAASTHWLRHPRVEPAALS